ncbi:MAG: lipoate--protein ligase family protein [bacterium]|nr:lipoate--protein ligase family protein [bacterium]
MHWRYLPFGTFTGEHNMSLDRQLLDDLQSGKSETPTLRFYCWDRPTISLGTNQTAEEVVIPDQIQRLNYGLVTRPTGGRALLHKGDICYAIIANRKSHPAFFSLTSTYRAIAQSIAAMLASLGINTTELPQTGTPARSNLNPCFAMLNPFEVTVRGRKICGSAQFRTGDFFLQHGSVRIFDNWNESDLCSLWPEGHRLDSSQITSIELETQSRPVINDVVSAFEQAIRDSFAVSFDDE